MSLKKQDMPLRPSIFRIGGKFTGKGWFQEGSYNLSYKKLSAMVEKHPQETLSILRAWMYPESK